MHGGGTPVGGIPGANPPKWYWVPCCGCCCWLLQVRPFSRLHSSTYHRGGWLFSPVLFKTWRHLPGSNLSENTLDAHIPQLCQLGNPPCRRCSNDLTWNGQGSLKPGRLFM